MKRKIKKPGEGPGAHGSIANPKIRFYVDKWLSYGVEIPATCDDFAAYFGSKNIRKLAKWLESAADYIESKEKP